MNPTPETEQLQEALTKLATAMTLVICSHVDHAATQIMAGKRLGEINSASAVQSGSDSPWAMRHDTQLARGTEEFINKREVARHLGKTLRTVDNWMGRGILPYYKIGRSVQFRWSEVLNHLAQTTRVRLGS